MTTPHAPVRQTPVTVSYADVGVHFGCVGVVRRARDRRIIHRTSDAPRPYGFHWAAVCDATDWALAHGYVSVTEDDQWAR